MGRKRFLQEVEIKTLVRTYTASLRQDQDTGMIHTGLCNDHVVETTPAAAIAKLREIADKDSGAKYFPCWVVDPGLLEPVVSEYMIAVPFATACITELPLALFRKTDDCPSRTHVAKLPDRWVVRTHTLENWRALQRLVIDLRGAHTAVSIGLRELASAADLNPTAHTVHATPVDYTETSMETPE